MDARRKRDQTVIDLNEFDANQTRALVTIESDLHTIGKLKKVIQFESGEFMAFEEGKKLDWDSCYLPETEEDEGLQHPLADLEIRAFDYSFLEIYGSNSEVKNKILNHLNKA